MGVTGCSQCTKADGAGAATCNTCQEGFYKDNTACTPCDTSCATCSGSLNTCTSCPEGKYLNGNQCVAKGSCGADKYEDNDSMTCAACSTLNGCTACALGDTGKPQCSACGASNKLKVELDGTITCVAEAQCATNGQEGTHFMDKANSVCVLCGNVTGSGTDQGIDNCMTCKRAQDDAKPVCDTCKEGYYLDSSKACQACTGRNCATCTETTKDKCADCKPNYRRQQNGGASDDSTCTRTCGDSKGHCPPPPSRRGQSSLYITTNCKPSRRRRSWTGCWGTRALRHAPDQAVLDGRAPLLTQMQAGDRLTP